jgi:hypothetical protein
VSSPRSFGWPPPSTGGSCGADLQGSAADAGPLGAGPRGGGQRSGERRGTGPDGVRRAGPAQARYAAVVRRLTVTASIALALLVAACGASGPETSPSSNGSNGSGQATTSAQATNAVASPGASSATPGSSPSADPGASGGSPTKSGPNTTADACTGSQTNHQFFANAAAALPWPVLCAVLPTGWYLDSGKYQLAGGGKFLITYKGPGGATVSLSEGAFCQDPGGCVPSGTDAGDAALGSRTGTFVNLDSGDFAIVVDRAATISWLFVAHGLDAATAKALGAALYQVAR